MLGLVLILVGTALQVGAVWIGWPSGTEADHLCTHPNR
jgi:hypothetical protein